MDLNVLGIIAALATMLATMIGGGVALARMIRGTTAALDGKIEKLDSKIGAVHRELVETRVALTDRAVRLEGAVLGVIAPEAANLRAAAESA